MSVLLLGTADWPKWQARCRSGVHPNRRAAALIDPHTWRDEPRSPDSVDARQFGRAFSGICSGLPERQAEQYAQWIIESARRHHEDPFLLGALAHRMSSCSARASSSQGVGLTAIQPTMYRENVRGRVLSYLVPDGAGWAERRKVMPRPLSRATLLHAESHIQWAAGLLAMWREQHGIIDQKFEQTPHRHYVSHFVWGDRVRSDRAEDRIFTDRRRLLMYYGEVMPEPTRSFRGVRWGSPLEASPRVVSSSPGESRDAGLRRHHGVDVEAMVGEPVLAMADGKVFFAGVDLPGPGALSLPPDRIRRVARWKLGKGGRFVCIDHAAKLENEEYLRSCYMHLDETRVSTGDKVKRGTIIGTVGLTGVEVSDPHLHLEIKSDRRLYDARDIVPGILVGHPPESPIWRKRVLLGRR